MPSTITIETLRERVAQLLEDNANDTWTEDELDAAIRLALARVSERRPREVTDTIDAEAREIDISALNVRDAESIAGVWFPFDASEANAQPNWVEYETFVYNDTLYLRLLEGEDPAPGDTARIVFYAPHTLEGLDDASVTTIYTRHETSIAKGAAAFAFLQRSGGVAEDQTIMAVATPNQAALFATWMEEFEKGLTPAAAGVSAFPSYGVEA